MPGNLLPGGLRVYYYLNTEQEPMNTNQAAFPFLCSKRKAEVEQEPRCLGSKGGGCGLRASSD